MAISWIDSHCHLDFPVFDADRAAVMTRAHAAGVTHVVVPGTTAERWMRLADIESEAGIHVAYGLHPWWTGEHRPEHLELLKKHLGAGRAVAVGECGLDFARDIDRNLQHHWFKAQLRLAADHGLPVIVHAVRALDAVLSALQSFPELAGVIHGFAGSRQQAERCVAAGFMLGIGPMVARSARLRALVRDMPVECLLLETDAPDRPLAGERGEPADVVAIAESVCAIKSIGSGELSETTSDNAKRLFQWEKIR